MAEVRAFECVLIDCTVTANNFDVNPAARKLMDRYKVRAWPTVMFLDPQGRKVHKMGGCKKPESLIPQMRSIAQRYAYAAPLRAAVGAGPEWDWVSERVQALQDADAAGRAGARDELLDLRGLLDKALRRDPAEAQDGAQGTGPVWEWARRHIGHMTSADKDARARSRARLHDLNTSLRRALLVKPTPVPVATKK